MLKRNIDLAGAIRLAVLPSKSVGLLPLTESGGMYKISLGGLALSLGMFTFVSTFSIYNLCLKGPSSEDLFTISEIIIMDLVMMISVYENLACKDSFNKCLEALEDVEECLNSFGRHSTFFYDCKHLLFNTSTGITVVVFRFFNYGLTERTDWYSVTKLLLLSLLLIQMVVLVQRYSGLLGIASDLLVSCKKEIIISYRHQPPSCAKRLEDLLEVHCKICVTSLQLNDCQEFQVLSIVFSCLVVSITEAYRTVLEITKKGSSSKSLLMMVNLFGITVFFNMCNQIVRACKSTSTEAKDFNTILYELMMEDRTTILSTNKKLRLHFAMKRDVVFTVCGFFKLDYTLLHSMVAATTTYLVILIQFQRLDLTE